MFSKFHQRSEQLEHIDIGDYSADEYEGCITELQLVNKWMGDERALRTSLLAEIENCGLQSVSILDVGAGSGQLLRVAADWARKTNRDLFAAGLELNARSVTAINEESAFFDEIQAIRGDALCLPFRDGTFDYAISSLFTHHFTDDQIIQIFREMARVSRRGICVIDLHRHPLAYFLYTTVGKLVLHNRLLREDGALSILRSFKPDELFALAQRAGLQGIRVAKHFPYRIVLNAAANVVWDEPLPQGLRGDQAA